MSFLSGSLREKNKGSGASPSSRGPPSQVCTVTACWEYRISSGKVSWFLFQELHSAKEERIQSYITMSVSPFLLISSYHTSSRSLPFIPIWYLIRALAAALSWLQLLYHVIAAPELQFIVMSAFTAWLTAKISICSSIHDLKGRFLTMYGSRTFLSWGLLAQMSSLFLHALSSNFLTPLPSCCFWFLSCFSSFHCCLFINFCSPHLL